MSSIIKGLSVEEQGLGKSSAKAEARALLNNYNKENKILFTKFVNDLSILCKQNNVDPKSLRDAFPDIYFAQKEFNKALNILIETFQIALQQGKISEDEKTSSALKSAEPEFKYFFDKTLPGSDEISSTIDTPEFKQVILNILTNKDLKDKFKNIFQAAQDLPPTSYYQTSLRKSDKKDDQDDMKEGQIYSTGGGPGEGWRWYEPKPAGLEEEQLDEKCWDGYKQVGMKKKGKKMVPNCVPKESVEEDEVVNEKENKGLWANIHAKRERIKRGSGERMRKPGSTGAPTAKAFKDSQKTSKSNESSIIKGLREISK